MIPAAGRVPNGTSECVVVGFGNGHGIDGDAVDDECGNVNDCDATAMDGDDDVCDVECVMAVDGGGM